MLQQWRTPEPQVALLPQVAVDTPAAGGFTTAGGCHSVNTPATVALPPQVAADTHTVSGFATAGGFSPANTPAAGASIAAGGCRSPAHAAKILQLNTAQSAWQGQLIATASSQTSY